MPRAARHRLLTRDLRATVTLRQVAPELLLRRHRVGGPRPVSCATRGMRLAPTRRAVCRPSRRARARRLMNDSRMSTCEGLAEACPGSPDTHTALAASCGRHSLATEGAEADKLPSKPCTPRPSPGGAGPHPEIEPEMGRVSGAEKGKCMNSRKWVIGKQNRAVNGRRMSWTPVGA